jgi:hypothetical protein
MTSLRVVHDIDAIHVPRTIAKLLPYDRQSTDALLPEACVPKPLTNVRDKGASQIETIFQGQC